MVNPNRSTTAGRVYNDLRNLAHRAMRSTDEVMVEYVLERFLYRLARSPAGQRHFVLKGGLLLAQFGARRVTRDIDILGQALAAGDEEIVRRIKEIAALQIDDGVTFDPTALKTVPIREGGEYDGVRLAMPAMIARACLKLQLDVSTGDPVTPSPQLIDYPQRLAPGSFHILGYPLVTIIAEKLATAVELGAFNTRDRDYADLHRLLRTNSVDGDEAAGALARTAEYRGVTLRPLSTVIADLPRNRQSSYTAWLRRQRPVADDYPADFSDTVNLVVTFADPLISGVVAGRTWDPQQAAWT